MFLLVVLVILDREFIRSLKYFRYEPFFPCVLSCGTLCILIFLTEFCYRFFVLLAEFFFCLPYRLFDVRLCRFTLLLVYLVGTLYIVCVILEGKEV